MIKIVKLLFVYKHTFQIYNWTLSVLNTINKSQRKLYHFGKVFPLFPEDGFK